MLCQRYSGCGCLCHIDQHINPAKTFHGLLDYLRHGRLIISMGFYICRCHQYFNTIQPFQLFFTLFQLLHIPSCYYQIGAFFCIGCGNTVTDGTASPVFQYSPSCSRNNCCFTCQKSHVDSSCLHFIACLFFHAKDFSPY